MQALNLWPHHPRLDFPDVLLAAYADLDGLTLLASFDRGFDRFGNLDRYLWSGTSQADDDIGRR